MIGALEGHPRLALDLAMQGWTVGKPGSLLPATRSNSGVYGNVKARLGNDYDTEIDGPW